MMMPQGLCSLSAMHLLAVHCCISVALCSCQSQNHNSGAYVDRQHGSIWYVNEMLC